MRPLWALRNLLRFGCSIFYRLLTGRALDQATLIRSEKTLSRRPDPRRLCFHHELVLRHRIMAQNFALEDPNLDPADAIGGVGFSFGIVDVRAQRVQRHKSEEHTSELPSLMRSSYAVFCV